MQKVSGMWRSALALLLVICMVVGVVPATASAAENEINYVSFGDSMTNGYGFVGYEQSSKDRAVYDIMTGKGIYGQGAYPLQFEEYLTGLGYAVNHTKLATSAMLPEDLLYLLGGREEFDDDWSGFKDYIGTYTDAELMPLFQKAVTEADVITMAMGNAAFGAFLLNRVTDALGVMGSSLDKKLCFEDAIAVIDMDEEQYALVTGIYDQLEQELLNKISPEMAEKYNLQDVIDTVAYTAASFIVNYRLLLEWVLEMNPDVEIVLVGLLNTTHGMKLTDAEGNEILAVGDTMDKVYNMINAYMAGLPAVLQAQGEMAEANLYFAAQPEPEFICEMFEELLDSDWGNLQNGRLHGETVRQRTISAYCGDLTKAIGAAIGGSAFAEITFEDVVAYEAINFEELKAQVEAAGQQWDPWAAFLYTGRYADPNTAVEKILSVAVYLAIEEAVARNSNTMDIPVDGLMALTGDMSTVFAGLGESDKSSPEGTRQWLYNGLQSSNVTRSMCKIYGLACVGNGMSVHPTPLSHDQIAASVISAYKNNTVLDETKKNIVLGMGELMDLKEAYGPAIADLVGYANLKLDGSSTYVALGDGTAAPKGYVELLAAQLKEQYGIAGYTNYSVAGNTVGTEKETVASRADLAAADLITIGFGNVTMLSNAFENAFGFTAAEYDWASLVGEDRVQYVDAVLGEVYGQIAEIGLDEETTEMLNTVVEGFAYGAVEYAIELPELITAIREVNADAVIVIVGQYNPLDGAVLKFGNTAVDVSEYLDYLVDGVTAHGVTYCYLTGEAIFVPAAQVETENTNKELTVAVLFRLLTTGFAALNPGAAGDQYIAQQIREALIVNAPEEPEDPKEPEVPADVQYGDATGDGKVNLQDAIMVLQAANGKDVTIDREAADVNGDGKVNLQDAIRILKRANGNTDPFPAEK